MNILITGIHGFVGSNLVVALKERHSLYGLDIVAPEKEGVVKTFSWKDIEPASFPMRNLPEFDAIIHLAGKAHDTKNRSAAQAYFDINMGLTQKIFDFFLESSAKKFVFFSSVKAAADSVVGDMLTEEVVSGIYHMGDDEALSTNELIALMCRALERKPHIWKINRGLMEFCARLGTLLHLPLNTERLRKLTENYVVSNAKIKAALGIDRMPVRAEEGIVRTIKSFSN